MESLSSSLATYGTTPRPPTTAERFEVRWARTQDEVRDAQRLRHRVFAEEMGARLSVPPGTPPRLDADRHDDFCEHLLVRTLPDDGEPGTVIGTYRVLLPEAARRAGGYYGEGEFDLAPLAPLLPRTVELGRACVHPDWRAGGVILALWGALAELMARNGMETMIGCASVSMSDGGHCASSLYRRLRETHLADAQWRVRPRLPLPVDELRSDLEPETPPLIKGYLRCGAQLLGAPAWDPDFNTADLPLMMQAAQLPPRYRRHFFAA